MDLEFKHIKLASSIDVELRKKASRTFDSLNFNF